MEKPCCLVYCHESRSADIELFFSEKKLDCFFMKQGEQLTQMVKTWSPFMILVDLTSPEAEWIFKHIASVETASPGFPIVAIVTKDQDTVKHRAESYGCRFVFEEEELFEKLAVAVERILTRQY